MAWVIFVVAGLLEIGWAIGLKWRGSGWHGDSRNRAARRARQRGANHQRCAHHRWNHWAQGCNTGLTKHFSTWVTP